VSLNSKEFIIDFAEVNVRKSGLKWKPIKR